MSVLTFFSIHNKNPVIPVPDSESMVPNFVAVVVFEFLYVLLLHGINTQPQSSQHQAMAYLHDAKYNFPNLKKSFKLTHQLGCFHRNR